MFFNDHYHWYIQMQAAGFSERLVCMSVVKMRVFAVSCATHALQVVEANLGSRLGPFELSQFSAPSTILDEFWRRYPSLLAPVEFAPFSHRARSLIEDALGPEPDMLERFTVPSAEALVWSTLSAVTKEAADDPVGKTEEAADCAYRATFYAFADDPNEFGGDKTREIELRTPECIAELRFQLACLAAVEASNPYPSGYEHLCRAAS